MLYIYIQNTHKYVQSNVKIQEYNNLFINDHTIINEALFQESIAIDHSLFDDQGKVNDILFS